MNKANKSVSKSKITSYGDKATNFTDREMP